jgi:hypothetical protein
MKKHKRKQNHRDFTFKEQIKFQHLFYGNSKPDNVLCILSSKAIKSNSQNFCISPLSTNLN